MKRKNRWILVWILGVALSVWWAGGCSKETVVEEEESQPAAYTRAQMMVIALSAISAALGTSIIVPT